MNTGYAKQQTMALENADPQQTLAWGLTTTARKMQEARRADATRDQVLEAVRLNWRLWTIIQAEQSDPDSPNPRNIREGLLNLANFIDKRSIALLANADKAELEVLININRNIAAGLLGTDLTPEERAERDRRNQSQAQINLVKG
ncbi:MAG TPA: flagellar biosynthesis regulator FlaF [Aliidongia sp.]|nr:flagellar biosynthesis regulator FlaF [Aliidongia sp.]